MPIKMQCPNCQQPLTVADHLAGKKINCPKCKNLAAVPQPGQPPQAAGMQAPMPSPAAPPPAEDDLALNIPGQDSTRHNETGEHKRCPGCGRDLPGESVLCTGCGHDFNTGQRRKGFEIKDPEKTRRLVGSIVRNGIVLLLLIGAAYGIYYAYKNGLFSAFDDAGKKAEEKKEEPKKQPKKKPKKKEKKAPAEIKDTLLVVVNNRFARLSVYADREKIGEVGYRKTEKITMEPPPKGEAVQISFEVVPPPGLELNPKVKKGLKDGVPFSGTTKQGLRVTLSGPPQDTVPEQGAFLPNVLDLEVVKSPSGLGLISSVTYKDCKLLPCPPITKLALEYGKQENKTVMKWVVQDCIVQRSGKVAYNPSPVPFESFGVSLFVKDGKLDYKD